MLTLTTMYALQTSTSSSSSSPSRAATPVDEIVPELVSFPRQTAQAAHSLRSLSSGSFKFSLEHQRPSSKAALPFIPRPPKLSLDTSKVRPIPALPSASTESPLGAFCPTSSAESHLRFIVKHSIVDASRVRPSSPTSRHSPNALNHPRSHSISSREPSEAKFPYPSSPSLRRLRASSFRSLRFSWSSADKEGHGQPSPYDVDDDSGDEHEAQETFWPRRKPKHTARKKVPSICRSPSLPSDDNSAGAPASPPAHISRHSTPSSTQARSRLGPTSKTLSSPFTSSTQSKAAAPSSSRPSLTVTTPLRPTMHVRSSTTSLLPPNPTRSGKSPKSVLITGNCRASGSNVGLDSTLAAVENASRLRSQCVCGVCGKAGSDYPRCPRCSATWCSRQCRISEAGGGKHVCRR